MVRRQARPIFRRELDPLEARVRRLEILMWVLVALGLTNSVAIIRDAIANLLAP